MKNQKLIVVLLLATLIIVAAAPICAAASLSKPTVTLPSNWEQVDETAYPGAQSEHDAQGAGLVKYEDQQNYDYVILYYENAPSTNYSSSQLKAETESIFNRDHTDYTFFDSGVMTVAGVQAGYAKGYDSTYDVYLLEIVFVKGSYYINAFALYDANTQSSDKVTSLLNSINSGTSFLTGTTLYIIVGVIVAIIVVVVVLLLVMRRRKKPTPQMQAAQPAAVNFPPPPPPA